jgi:NitT/TauT family transport system permease protein
MGAPPAPALGQVKAQRLDYLWLVLGFLALWQGLFAISGPEALASPATTLSRALRYLQTPQFWVHVHSTGIAFVYACIIALLGGLALGLWLGFRRFAGEVADPILGSLYSIPKITLYPVILLIFGLGVSAKVAFGAIHGLFPVAIFAMNGVRKVAPIYLKTAHVMGLGPWATVKTVLIPAAMPEIVTGLRIGFSSTLLGTLIGELFASNAGIGFILIRAMEAHNVPDIMALTLLLFTFAATANGLLLLLERRVRHGLPSGR